MTGQVTLSETMLIAAIPAGGSTLDAATSQLVRDRARMVYQIAYSVLRDHHDAEDASQEVFLRVWKYRGKLQDVGDTKAWVARIAWNVSLERRPKQKPVSLDDDAHANLKAALASDSTAADDLTAQRQMQEWLAQEIPLLPQEFRAPLLLSTVEELNSTEIAEILKISEGTVRTRLFRARQRLKDRWAESLGKK